jgi:hypothetical protein
VSTVPGLPELKWPPTYGNIMESLNNSRDIARWRRRVEAEAYYMPGGGMTPASHDCPPEPTAALMALESRAWHELATIRQEALRRLLGIPKPPKVEILPGFDPFKDEDEVAA